MDQDKKFLEKVVLPPAAGLLAATGGDNFEINKMKTAKDIFKKEKEIHDLRHPTMQQVQGGMDLPSQTKWWKWWGRPASK